MDKDINRIKVVINSWLRNLRFVVVRAIPTTIHSGQIDMERVLACYNQCIEFVVEKAPTYKQFDRIWSKSCRIPNFCAIPTSS